MSISDQLLASLVLYGLPVLVGVILVAAVGVPLPASLLLIAAGAFVEQGQLPYAWTALLATTAAVVGDNIGYSFGRWGGPRSVARISRWVGGDARLGQAEHAARRWGGLGIFLSRWLFAPLGPALNVTSGLVGYPWSRFFIYDLAGELLWVLLYTAIGRVFSDRVQAIDSVLGNLTWALCGVLGASLVGWYVVRRVHDARAELTLQPHEALIGESPHKKTV